MSGIPGVADTPEDKRNVAKLKRYWAYEEGRQKWVNSPHPFTTLEKLLVKYIPNERMRKGFAAEVFHAALGFWPGTPHVGTTPTPGKKRR